VKEGRFREDLYHRLNVIHLRLPPLRDRREDIPMLLAHFLDRFCKENDKPLRQFTPAAMKLLMDYDWPGNVRELENVVERAVVLSTQERVDVDLLPDSIRSKEIVRGVRFQLSEFLPPLPGEPGSRTAADNPNPSLFQIIDEVERRIIVDMEPDRGCRALPDSSFHLEPENQTPGYRRAPTGPNGRCALHWNRQVGAVSFWNGALFFLSFRNLVLHPPFSLGTVTPDDPSRFGVPLKSAGYRRGDSDCRAPVLLQRPNGRCRTGG
jgi:hypothetical protein